MENFVYVTNLQQVSLANSNLDSLLPRLSVRALPDSGIGVGDFRKEEGALKVHTLHNNHFHWFKTLHDFSHFQRA